MRELELRTMHQQFLDLNVQAFTARHFEVAYHTLAAATLCAEDLSGEGLLTEVRQKATEQGRWIDENAADHRLSSRHAQARGNEGVFTTLARQAHSMLLGL